MRALAVVVLLVASSAAADDTGLDVPLAPSVRFGAGDSQDGCIIRRAGAEQLALALYAAPDHARLDIRFTLRAFGVVRVPLGIPHGARITRFAATAAASISPDGASFEHRDLVLAIAPESLGDTDTVELSIELPPTPSIEIEPILATSRIVTPSLELNQPRAFTLAALPIAEPAHPALDSVYAAPLAGVVAHLPGERRRGPSPPMTIRVADSWRWISSADIRDRIQFRYPQLRRCYTRVAQGQPTLRGEADVHFSIAADGHVTDVEIDGTLANPDVTDCLAAEIATLDFPATDTQMRVNYPLRFVPVFAR